jgi:hypothetical protein
VVGQIACSRCGAFIEEREAFYNADGDKVCGPCNQIEEQDAADKKGDAAIKAAALWAVCAGFLGFCCNPAFLVTIFGGSAAFGVISAFRYREPEWKKDNEIYRVLAIVGAGLIVLQVVFIGLRILLGVGSLGL